MKKTRSETKVSVIIPTFNRAKYLYATLICLCNQKANVPYEVVIIDSGNDETKNVVQLFSNSNPNIVYHKIGSCKNRSLIRNKGAEIASGEILIFLDNDMLVPPNFIQRHFEVQAQRSELVLLGYRKSLTQFDIEKINSEFLVNDFYMLDELPWYDDPRKGMDFSLHPWRFLYSHSFSLKRDLFFKAKEFDIDFGENWGYEDMELGFRLYKMGLNFQFLEDICSFHQPHFNQSLNEQSKTFPNKRLFLKKHNCFEVELVITMFEKFEKYYFEINKTSNDSSFQETASEKNCAQIIVGIPKAIERSEENTSSFLGLAIPLEDKSVESIYICNQFISFPEETQLLILKESIRVAKKIIVSNMCESEKKSLEIMFKKIGYGITFEAYDDLLQINAEHIFFDSYYTLLLPDVANPEKRFVYEWIGLELAKNNYVQLIDLKKASTVGYEDFCYDKYNVNKLDVLLNNFLPFSNGRFIVSAAETSNSLMPFPDSLNTVIFDDSEYPSKNPNTDNCIHFSGSDFAYITFYSVLEYMRSNKTKNDCTEIYRFCCFMENGFYEDGINQILDVFKKVKTEKDKLIIKVVDYEKLCLNFYPLHNDTSKKAKTFHSLQKHISDEFLLYKTINELGLNDFVEIRKTNLCFSEIIDIISMSKNLLWLSKGVYVSPEVYVAILLNKTVFVANYHIVPEEIKKSVLVCDSKESFVSKELHLPNTLEMMNYMIYSTESDSLEELVQAEDIKCKPVNVEAIKAKAETLLDKIVNNAFVESKKPVSEKKQDL